jgi:hypothetical protein
MNSLGIACASGTYKGVFVHGVLSAFEASGFRADAYAGASSSTLSTAAAAMGKAVEMGVACWCEMLRRPAESGGSMSEVVLQSISKYGSMLREHLGEEHLPRLIIAASAVASGEAAEETQGQKAKHLGRRLLISAMRKERSWVDSNLRTHLFDTAASDGDFRLTADNFDAVAYASTRMLHAWDIPAWVDGKPYVDASYTCSCPALELVRLGYSEIIAIATEPGTLYTDLFRTQTVPTDWNGVPIHIIKPETDLKDMGVDFTSATEEGFVAAYRHGEEKGREFISGRGDSRGS